MLPESTSCLRNRNGRGAAALVSLGRHNLVIEATHVHAKRSPSFEVVGSGHGTAGSLVLANGPVLVECRRAGDRGLVHLLVLVDIIHRAITGDSTLVGHGRAWVVGAVIFQDVVLDEWASSPAVDGKVCVSRWVE